MLLSLPPMNFPLIPLPFFNSNESAGASPATKHMARTIPQFCLKLIVVLPVIIRGCFCFQKSQPLGRWLCTHLPWTISRFLGPFRLFLLHSRFHFQQKGVGLRLSHFL